MYVESEGQICIVAAASEICSSSSIDAKGMMYCGSYPKRSMMSSNTWLPQKFRIFIFFDFFTGGFTMLRKTAWYAASNPVVQIFERKPSHEQDTTGIPSSFVSFPTTPSISSPIIPAAQDVVTKIAFGWTLSYAR